MRREGAMALTTVSNGRTYDWSYAIGRAAATGTGFNYPQRCVSAMTGTSSSPTAATRTASASLGRKGNAGGARHGRNMEPAPGECEKNCPGWPADPTEGQRALQRRSNATTDPPLNFLLENFARCQAITRQREFPRRGCTPIGRGRNLPYPPLPPPGLPCAKGRRRAGSAGH